jgi:hypothetical protein
LEKSTLIYILLPFLIFTLGWVKPFFAVPIVGIVLFGLYRAMQEFPTPTHEYGPPRAEADMSRRRRALTLTIVFALVLFVVAFSGEGGYSYQSGSFLRHNAFLRDLIEQPWPLAYWETGPEDMPGMPAFYMAFSLTPALVGKALGWSAANHFSVLWAVLGVFLAVCWFLKIVGTISPLYALLFLFVGALDILGQVALLGWFHDGTQIKPLSYWMFHYAFSSPGVTAVMGGGGPFPDMPVFWISLSNIGALYLCAQHAFAAWLGLLMILHDATKSSSCHRVGFVWACSLLWSAFTFIGLLPFVIIAIVTTRGRGLFSFQNVVAGLSILGLSALFIGSNNHDYPHGWLWEYQNVLRTWPALALFYIVQFGIYLTFCPSVDRSKPGAVRPVWWWTAIATLLALPWYYLGGNNDFSIKAAVPSLLVVLVFLATAVKGSSTEVQRKSARLLIGLMIVGSFGALQLVTRGIGHGLDSSPPPLEEVLHVNEIERSGAGAQLFSDGDSFFWKVLAKRIQLR